MSPQPVQILGQRFIRGDWIIVPSLDLAKMPCQITIHLQPRMMERDHEEGEENRS
jgi:hypothetical protein